MNNDEHCEEYMADYFEQVSLDEVEAGEKHPCQGGCEACVGCNVKDDNI